MKLSQAKEFLPFVQAAAEGKKIEFRFDTSNNNGWVDVCENSEHFDLKTCAANYRIKPTPELRAWKPEEVPVGALIKEKAVSNFHAYMITAVDSAIHYVNDKWISPSDAFANYLHSLDNGKTWLPCGVEESE